MGPAGITLDIHDSAPYSWTMANREPHPALADHVVGYTGYEERSVLPLSRRQVANGGVVVIVTFGDPIDVRPSTDPTPGRYGSFVAGLHDGWVVTEHGGRQHGVEIDLTPLGAHRLLGVPPNVLANRVVDLDSLGDRRWGELADRMASAPGWAARFELLDDELLARAATGPDADPAVRWAWRQLVASRGQVAVSVLADEIGWSRRHFAARFRHHVGVPPKAAARILRFEHAVALLTGAGTPTISAVAAACGYADHSHLVRDFHELAGCTPSSMVAAQLPDGGGIAG